MNPQQEEAIIRMILAIIQSGRWPMPEDLRRCVELSDSMLGLGMLLDTGAEVASTLLDVEQWRSARSRRNEPVPNRFPQSVEPRGTGRGWK